MGVKRGEMCVHLTCGPRNMYSGKYIPSIAQARAKTEFFQNSTPEGVKRGKMCFHPIMNVETWIMGNILIPYL